jgi:protein-disulfide isomerase/uncharacterized membrane protein
MSFVDVLEERLKRYQSTWEQVLFGVSLLGILTVSHLAIQQGREFDRGCLGFSGLEAGQMGFDCSAVVSSSAGMFLGLSNITWGLGFYLAIALLSMGVFALRSKWRTWVRAGRLTLILVGAAYSGYLAHVQVNVLNTLCVLCMVSTVLVGLLLVLEGVLLIRTVQSSDSTMSTRLFKRNLTIYVYLAAFAAVLIGADLTYFEALAPGSQERETAHQKQFSGAACQLDTQKEPVDPSSLVSMQDVTKGPSDASVTVVEYFDPNCPHCKDFHEVMKEVVSQYEDQVRFVFKPFPLRGSSLPEIQALYVAHQQGKFTEMLEAQYARQSRTGITEQDLEAIASEIDMNPEVLLSRIDQDKYRKQIVAQRKRAIEIGVDSTPTVLVNGHFVGSRSQECMELFIDRALSGKLESEASS